MQLTEPQHREIRQAVADFKRGMEIRSGLNLRVARRVTAILRIGILGMGVITLLLLVMLYAFNSRLVAMSAVLATMNQQFQSMSADMNEMTATVRTMKQNVSFMPAMVDETTKMRTSVSTLNHNITGMTGKVSGIQTSMTGITGDIGHMTHTFRMLDPAVQNMGTDINKLSKPSRMFNSIMPFMW